MTTTQTTTRIPNHVGQTMNGSETIHAMSDSHVRPYHVLACNGRAVQAFAWSGSPDQVTCKACQKALDNGKAVWTA